MTTETSKVEDIKETGAYSHTEVPDDCFTCETFPRFEERFKIKPFKMENKFGGNHAEWYLNDGKSEYNRPIDLLLDNMYTKFGVGELKSDGNDKGKPKKENKKDTKKELKKDPKKKAKKGSDDEDDVDTSEDKGSEKGRGVAFPILKNPRLKNVCTAIDKAAVREYSLNGKLLTGDDVPIEIAGKLLMPTARLGKNKENNERYGPNFKCKVDHNTLYYIKNLDGTTKQVDASAVDGKEGFVTAMGSFNKLNLGGKYSVGFLIEYYLIEFKGRDSAKFKKFLNPGQPTAPPPPVEGATSTEKTPVPKEKDEVKEPLMITGKRKFEKDEDGETSD